MARVGQNIRARNARPGDVVDLAPGSSLNWLSDAVGQMSYEDLDEKWGLIDKNPTGDTKNVICLADLSGTDKVKGPRMSGIMETDASAIPEDQIDCLWIPIPDNVTVSMRQPGATRQLGADRDAGFIGLLRKGARKLFGGGRKEQPTEEPEFAPTQITGLPVPLTSKLDEEPFVRVGTDHQQRDEEEEESIPLSGDIIFPESDSNGYESDDQEDVDRVFEGQYRFIDEEEQQDTVDRVLELPPVRGGNWEFGDDSPVERGEPLTVQERGFSHWSSDDEDDDPSSLEDPEQELIEEGQPGPKRKRGVKFKFGSGPTYYLTAEGLQELLVQPYEAGEFGKDVYDKGIRLASKPIKRRDAIDSGIAPDVFEAQVEAGYWSTNPNDFFISESNTALAIREPDTGKDSWWDTTKRRAGTGVKFGGDLTMATAEATAAGVGGGVGLASKLRSPLARLGGAALTGMHAATGKALEGTLAGKMLNIETKRLTMLSRVPVGETIMFTVGDDRVGVRRGDRGEVRMGGRGKAKVVYFHDTGEIVHPDQWTMVAITGKVPTSQTGTLGMGLGLFGQTGHWPQQGYRDRGWTPTGTDAKQQFYGEFPEGFVELMLAIPVSHKDESSERRRFIIAKQFGIEIGKPSSEARKELYRRLRGQRQQVIIRRPEDEPDEHKKRGGRGTVVWNIKRNEDTNRWYLQTIIPAQRIPSENQSPDGWKIYKSRANILQGADLIKHNSKVIELLKKQPDSTAEEDIDPYITHSGLVGADEAGGFDPDSESEREMERMRIMVEVRKEAAENQWSTEQENAELEKRMKEGTGAAILEIDF